LGGELTPLGVRDAGEIERAITTFARGSNDGLIMVGPTSSVQRHRDLVITLAARLRLPAVYSNCTFVIGGGLVSYGTDTIDQYRRAAGYVDRILKGEMPADLPVQAPVKFRAVDQPEDRQSARPRSAADPDRPRRRSDRVKLGVSCCICSRPLLALCNVPGVSVLTLLLGAKRTSAAIAEQS
jgi:hypothetical protein